MWKQRRVGPKGPQYLLSYGSFLPQFTTVFYWSTCHSDFHMLLHPIRCHRLQGFVTFLLCGFGIRSVDLNMCVMACANTRDTLRSRSSGAFLFVKCLSLGCSLSIQPGEQASKPQGSSWLLLLLSSGRANMCPHAWLSTWVLEV